MDTEKQFITEVKSMATYAQNMVSLTNFKIVSLSSELSKARSTAKKRNNQSADHPAETHGGPVPESGFMSEKCSKKL